MNLEVTQNGLFYERAKVISRSGYQDANNLIMKRFTYAENYQLGKKTKSV